MQAMEPLFRDLGADQSELEASEIESMCMKCYKNVKPCRLEIQGG